MNKNEEQISAQIQVINDMLKVVCDELNDYDDIDDFEIELQESSYQWCLERKPKKEYRIIVTAKRDVNN